MSREAPKVKFPMGNESEQSKSRRFRNACGSAVRRARVDAELTQEQLASRLQLAGLLELDRVGLAKIESRIRSVYDFELAVIASTLGLDVSDLVPSEEELKSDLPDLLEGRRVSD